MKKRTKIIIILVLICVLAAVFLYERSLYRLDDFRFRPEYQANKEVNIFETEGTVSADTFIRAELEEILIAYGMDRNIVNSLPEETLREWVGADRIEVRVNYLKIGRTGKTEYISAEQAETVDEQSANGFI